MALASTTPKAIRASIITLIKAITPTERPDAKWTYVPSPKQVGGKLRVFSIEETPADVAGSANSDGPDAAFDDGMWGGDGTEWGYELRVVTSYEGLTDEDDNDVITADAVDLWNVLRPTPGSSAGSIAGLIRVRRGSPDFRQGSPTEEDPDSGAWIVAHVFDINYKQADP